MNELFDKLILRVFFSVFICGILFLYKFAHTILYPSSQTQFFKKFYPSRNSADTLHLFGRIIGIGIIYSGLYFDMEDGIFLALLAFFIKAVIGFTLYLVSIYILESITLYNFEYIDEIIKRKNHCYGMISFSQSISLALILNAVIHGSNNSLLLLLFLWLFAIVIFGFSTKFYKIVSKLSFNKLIIHKNMGLAFSYSGYLFGTTVIIISSFKQNLVSIESYSLQVLLKILLSSIIFPIFQKGLMIVFKLQDDVDKKNGSAAEESKEMIGPNMGYGVYEGSIFFTSCFFTSIITGHILFGNFYPLF